MSGAHSTRAAVVASVAIMVLAVVAPSGAVGVADAADPEGSGTIVYVTDSGFEVEDASDGPLPNGSFFSDADTVALPGLTLNATGTPKGANPGGVTVNNRTGNRTNVSVGIVNANVTLAPANSSTLVLLLPDGKSLTFEEFTYGKLEFNAATSGADFSYQSTFMSNPKVQIQTGLKPGTKIKAADPKTGNALTTVFGPVAGTVGPNGAVTLTLPIANNGYKDVDIFDESTKKAGPANSGQSLNPGATPGNGNSGGGNSGPSVSVSPVSASTGGSGSSADEGGSAGASDSEATDGESADQQQGASDRKAVSLRRVGTGKPVSIDLGSADDGEQSDGSTAAPGADAEASDASQATQRNVLPDGLDIRFARTGDYDLEVSSRDIDVFDRAMDDPDATATPDLSMDALDDDSKRFVGETNQRPVGFIEVETNFDSEKYVHEATHKFRVRKTYLEATGASVDTVRLYRDETDGWRSLPTRQVDEDETFYYFEADTPGFSVFAIGTSSPIFETGTASLDSFDETTGAVVATVPVANIGDAPGEFEATLTADGTTVATQAVTVGANETADVTVAGTLDTAGSATLQFAGQSVGDVTYLGEELLPSESDGDDADASAQADSGEMGAADADDEASSGLGVSGIGLSLALVLGLLLFFVVWRRRDDEEEDSETTR